MENINVLSIYEQVKREAEARLNACVEEGDEPLPMGVYLIDVLGDLMQRLAIEAGQDGQINADAVSRILCGIADAELTQLL
jgi:hypothetical protein